MKCAIICDLGAPALDAVIRLRELIGISSPFPPHLTLVYPFVVDDVSLVKEHLHSVLDKQESFSVVAQGVERSPKGYYLRIPVTVGAEELFFLRKELLSDFVEELEVPWSPHITIACFDSEEELLSAESLLKETDIYVSFMLNNISLVSPNPEEGAFETFSLE